MKRPSLAVQLAVAVVAGAIVGRLLGARAGALGAFALFYIKLLKLLATPLVAATIVDTFARARVQLRPAMTLLALSTMNAIVACVIALGLMHAVPFVRFVDSDALRRAVAPPPGAPTAVERTIAWASSHLIEPILVENILSVIAVAILVGVLARVLASGRAAPLSRGIERAAAWLLERLMRVLGWAVRGVPLAAFGVVAKVAGSTGWAVLSPLVVFTLLVAFAIGLQVFGWYSLVLRVTGRSPFAFFRTASPALFTAFAGGSSLATLPVTLETLERELGVRPQVARLAACVGTNLDHDGIILYEAVAALFVAHAFAMPLGVAAQLKMIGTSVLAAVGIAGVPEAGLITLSLVLGAAGLPLGAVPLLMPVDWLLGRFRATANVASDLVVATLIDRATRVDAAAPGVQI